MCLKKGKFSDEDQKSDSQITLKVFLRKVIHKSAKSDSQYCESLCQSDSQLPQK